jgi:hypothetical protein
MGPQHGVSRAPARAVLGLTPIVVDAEGATAGLGRAVAIGEASTAGRLMVCWECTLPTRVARTRMAASVVLRRVRQGSTVRGGTALVGAPAVGQGHGGYSCSTETARGRT